MAGCKIPSLLINPSHESFLSFFLGQSVQTLAQDKLNRVDPGATPSHT